MSAAFITEVALKDFCVEYLVMKKDKLYRITLTEEQLRLAINAIEDWHRFLAGDCGMFNALSLIDNYREAKEALKPVEQFMTDLQPGS